MISVVQKGQTQSKAICIYRHKLKYFIQDRARYVYVLHLRPCVALRGMSPEMHAIKPGQRASKWIYLALLIMLGAPGYFNKFWDNRAYRPFVNDAAISLFVNPVGIT